MAKRRQRSRACPCGHPAPYEECCGPLHRGRTQAETAEQLMRARYSAFAVGDTAYLLSSWHPSTRPAILQPDPAIRWDRLEIIRTIAGTADHLEGRVEFRAHYTRDGASSDLHENSRFTRHQGAWVYVDGN